jgi:uncharacterized protein YcaQ
MDRLAVLQIDSVNVVERAHYLPLYSRLGAYDRALVDRAATRAPRRLLETWAHEASYVRPAVYHLMSWRRAQPERYAWGLMNTARRDHPAVVAAVRALIGDHGPLTARAVHGELAASYKQRSRTGWGWNWTLAKAALEWLFFLGEVAAAARTPSFERLYDLADRVVPPRPPDLPTDPPDQIRALVAIAARAHGVGTARCLADYFRLPVDATRTALAELVEAGVVAAVAVEGWSRPAYLDTTARLPRAIEARALFVAFDPLVFERRRLEDLFGFRYRLEYYLPPDQRVHGYYVMPFLWGDRFVARVDLKADRAKGQLLVKAAHVEAAENPAAVAAALTPELLTFATWLNLARVVVPDNAAGAAAAPLARILGSGLSPTA